jgi:transposase-like protein
MAGRISQQKAHDQEILAIDPHGEMPSWDLDRVIRNRLREMIEEILTEELNAMLGIGFYGRGAERRGYRNGIRERTITCQAGTQTISVPRGRLFQEEGASREFRSEFLPYYKRRTQAVDEALLATYLCGTSTRKIKKALKPLWKKGPLSRSSVSRLAPRFKARLEEFNHRNLGDREWVYLYLDALFLRVRLGGKVVSVPVMVALGVDGKGQKELLSLSLYASESKDAWFAFCEDLRDRGVHGIALVMIDGNKGLRSAVGSLWSSADVQRCTVHKERNLLRHTPKHAREEVKADYLEIIHAATEKGARRAKARLIRKWKKKLPDVVKSLEEAGEELLTFFRYPVSQWKSLRTTNSVERLNEEFRRRVKVQGSLPDSQTAVALLCALWEDGCIKYRRIDGHGDMSKIPSEGRLITPATRDLDKVA